MTDKTYNGWSNYATWRINLEIFDDLDISEFHGIEDKVDPELICLHTFSEALKDYAEECIFSGHNANAPQYCNLIEDYARAFLSDVNWYEIAKHMVNDYILENQE
jgi:hypothetical protein